MEKEALRPLSRRKHQRNDLPFPAAIGRCSDKITSSKPLWTGLSCRAHLIAPVHSDVVCSSKWATRHYPDGDADNTSSRGLNVWCSELTCTSVADQANAPGQVAAQARLLPEAGAPRGAASLSGSKDKVADAVLRSLPGALMPRKQETLSQGESPRKSAPAASGSEPGSECGRGRNRTGLEANGVRLRTVPEWPLSTAPFPRGPPLE